MIDFLIEDKSIQGWIFDLDGVITDTAKNHYQAWKRLSDEEGMTFDEIMNEKLRGVSRRASLDIILGGRIFPEEKILEMMDRKNSYYRESLNNLTTDNILPGIIPLLNRLKESDKKLAIGSASRNTEFILKHLGIRSFFDGVSTGAHVKRAKPAPDVFIHAAGQLVLAIDNCIVIEDAGAGIRGAKTAGFRTIGIGPEERVGQADYRFDSTEDLLA